MTNKGKISHVIKKFSYNIKYIINKGELKMNREISIIRWRFKNC